MKKYIIGLLIVVTCLSFSFYRVQAKEAVTPVSDILYSVENAGVYAAPDDNQKELVLLPGNAPVKVTGITSNGWFQVEINGTYYVKADGLKRNDTYSEEEIQKMTEGSFSFYSTKDLSEFSASDVLDMDANTYLKYLDSFLRGNGVLGKCIMQDTGLTLSEHVKGKKEANPALVSKSEKDFLVDYRLQYLQSSLEGPFRTSRALYLSMTRAIRYGKNQYTARWKNASIGDQEDKMREIISENVERIQKEQGVTFTYTLSYENEYWSIRLQMK